MQALTSFLQGISDFVWGPTLIVLLLGTGLYLTVGLRFMPMRRIPLGFRMAFSGRKTTGEEGDITPFQALTTALAATVGTGNIAGVATAIVIGGPGAVFWMWMTAFVGMATKYAEAVLAVKFREVDEDNRHVGGPMYYIKNGLGPRWAWLGTAFALFASFAAVGVGNMVQANSLADVFQKNAGIAPLWTGIGLAIVTFLVIIGGIRAIATVAEKIVPLMAVLYVVGALTILLFNIADVPGAFAIIFTDAFTGTAATGGFAGAAVMMAIRFGVARGIFSNEAGLGSAAIAHAAARTNDPVRQGTVAMLGTFIDTIVICTMTALVILTVDVNIPVKLVEKTGTDINGAVVQQWVCPTADERTAIAAGTLAAREFTAQKIWQGCDNGATVTSTAFANGIPYGEWIVTFGLIFFAFTTILGWSFYGERAAEFLFGVRVIMPYRLIWVLLLIVGATQPLDIIWIFADICNALMAVPNLIALLLLSGTVFALSKGADLRLKSEEKAAKSAT